MKVNPLDLSLREVIENNSVVYVNQDSAGTGCLYVKGKRVLGIKKLVLKATTNDEHVHFLEMQLDVAPSTLDCVDIEGSAKYEDKI